MIFHPHLSFIQLCLRSETYEYKDAEHPVLRVCLHLSPLSRLDVLYDQGVQEFLSFEFLHDAVPHKFYLGVGKGFFLDGFCRTKRISSMNHGHLSGIFCEEKGFFNGCISSSYHENLQTFEESAVAGGAIGYATTRKLFFARTAQGGGLSSVGKDNCLCLISIVQTFYGLRLSFQFHFLHRIINDLSAEMHCLGFHALYEARPRVAFQSAGIVGDFCGIDNLPSFTSFLNDQCTQSGTTGIESG